jgi:hypothetical protein
MWPGKRQKDERQTRMSVLLLPSIVLLLNRRIDALHTAAAASVPSILLAARAVVQSAAPMRPKRDQEINYGRAAEVVVFLHDRVVAPEDRPGMQPDANA